MILDGKAVADKIIDNIAQYTRSCAHAPGLAIIRVGNDPASEVYVRNKIRACKRAGIAHLLVSLDSQTGPDGLYEIIRDLNEDRAVDGIILQLPVPEEFGLDADCVDYIDPAKDVDGLTSYNRSRLYTGEHIDFCPCTPLGILTLLDEYGVPLEGANVCIIGRSKLVGLPLSLLMTRRNATVTICHSYTRNISRYTRYADIVVSAAGKPGLITADMIKPDTTVIDVGINRDTAGNLCGDCAADVAQVAGLITPVPGGVGPMTVAMLMKNTVTAFKKRRKLP